MAETPPVSKHGSKSIGEDRRRDAEAAARAGKGLPPLPEAPNDEGHSSGSGRDGPAPKPAGTSDLRILGPPMRSRLTLASASPIDRRMFQFASLPDRGGPTLNHCLLKGPPPGNCH